VTVHLQSIGDPAAMGPVGAAVLAASLLVVVAWLLYLYR
jgi:hypothetical protein